ncbi:MAG: hypothetical protein A2X22_03900 [Bacteroidetes bacterium GWF2_49_14]|nr:MAG: hypothetical protein A2X22_03900 [Bacteroidetes bacterium GWF2_49_14]HBB90395.1 hypothetical protein [Bacteroidales bacterium]
MKFQFATVQAFGILLVLIILTNCKKDLAPPVASFEINSRIGYTGRMFTFDAAGSIDPDGESFLLKSRWDFNDDGVWDTEYSSDRSTNWIYNESGNYTIRLEVVDPDGQLDQFTDSLQILGRLPDSVLIDTRDGQLYPIVKINGLWIMAENLRYGTQIPTSTKQTNNNIVEYYLFNNDSAFFKSYGGLYKWEESMNWRTGTQNQGICPPGWRIPELNDWYRVDIKVPHAFLSEYYGPSSLSGLNLTFSGSYLDGPVNLPGFIGSHFSGDGSSGAFWFNHFSTASSGIRVYGWIGFWEYPNSNLDLWNLKGLQINKASFDQRDNKGKVVFIDSHQSVRCVRDE